MTHPPTGSSPSYLSASPIRSSPLTGPPHFSPNRTPSPSPSTSTFPRRSDGSVSSSHNRRFSQPASSLSRPSRSIFTPFTPSSPPTSTSPTPDPSTPPSHPASPPLSRSQPLLGSYQLSLLHSRMSRTQSHSLASSSTAGFSLRIGSVGKGRTCPPELRAPPPLTLPFSATYYDLLDPEGGSKAVGGAAQTPWVGNIDLEQVYYERYSSRSPSPEGPISGDPPPDHPGYQVAPIGQLQIIVKSALAPLRVFIVPYDLRSLLDGARLLVRERTYVEAEHGGGSVCQSTSLPSPSTASRREYLRYAIQLQFVCLPSVPISPPATGASTTRRPRQSAPATTSHLDPSHLSHRQYYLSKTIKVIFSAHAPSSTEQLRTERKDEVVPPSEVSLGSAGRVVGFSPASAGAGRKGGEEWAMVRQKWIARRRVQKEEEGAKADVGAGANGKAEDKHKLQLVSPTATSSPLPIRSPMGMSNTSLMPIMPNMHSAGPSRASSRPPTPHTEGFPRVASPPSEPGAPSLLQMSKPGQVRKGKRQGSLSAAERELSERLRSMEVRNEEE
ncbi:uncharacterized protein MKK02DRAFT_41710 [Dioszegia hungarica]|uniref:Atos-like conserved domain-containing protein n=1 Tax=Dioszegia hungarica TaxID=4972 RepID=A0AA38H183_9TREE|nr:uncharacterized protein MKK02DRAFT_41710 [Dioszegia hungarica]KAI9632065.1 hypothetical protein MKK02DRAFT_41710 [Dioszegia hungarica]